MAEFQVVSRAPMRVVALGRSGVGKSHVLNQLLRELAEGSAAASAREEERMTTRWPAESLTVSSVVAHDERAEEEAADHLRAVEDGDGRGGTALEEERAGAPPPPMDARTSGEVYIPRHMRGQAIRGDAAKFSDADAIRKKKLKEASKRTNKKGGQKVKPSSPCTRSFRRAREGECEKRGRGAKASDVRGGYEEL